MNWKLLGLLSLFGMALSFLTILYFNPILEQFLWLMVFLGSSYFIFKYCEKSFFLNGFLLGWLNCFWVILIHSAFIQSFLRFHIKHEGYYSSLPIDVSPVSALIVMELAKGVFTSFVLGSFAFVMAKGLKKMTDR